MGNHSIAPCWVGNESGCLYSMLREMPATEQMLNAGWWLLCLWLLSQLSPFFQRICIFIKGHSSMCEMCYKGYLRESHPT
jgi:hypothetical protein